MAGSRDYKAEYQRRNDAAKRLGFSGYGQRRTARDHMKAIGQKITPQHERATAKAIKRVGIRSYKRISRKGIAAMRRKDWNEARRLARLLGLKTDKRSLGRVFGYH